MTLDEIVDRLNALNVDVSVIRWSDDWREKDHTWRAKLEVNTYTAKLSVEGYGVTLGTALRSAWEDFDRIISLGMPELGVGPETPSDEEIPF